MNVAAEMTSDRDIGLVLVTGAGASRDFGVNNTRLPMMGDWSNAVIDKLSKESWAYVEAAGLSKDMSGPDFEQRLGDFLHQAQAFQQIEPLVPHTDKFQTINPPMSVGMLAAWYSQATHHVNRIIELIHTSLYEQFASGRIDMDAAAAAYSSLFANIGVTSPSSLVLATTNYDLIGEYAIKRLGGLADWGAAPPLTSESEVPLRVDRLLDGYPRYVPVLHLHGRIGWHRRTDGVVYSSNSDHHDPGFGVPIVMLPGPNKAYDTEPVIFELWEQFEHALQRAQRVFVLGHSLHDKPLVDSLRRNVSPPERVGVGVLSVMGEPDETHPSASETLEILRTQLPRAAMIPMRFARNLSISVQELKTWDERLSQALAFAS